MKLKPYVCFACFPKDNGKEDTIIIVDHVPRWLMILNWIFRKRDSKPANELGMWKP